MFIKSLSFLCQMIITLSGLPGSGKGTIGKALAKELHYTFYSMGDLRGKRALELGITIDELNKRGETDPRTDKDIDEYQTRLAEQEDNLVIDGRTSWYFIPRSVKIFLDVDLAVAAERIFKDQREDEPAFHSPEEILKTLEKRIESDKTRYRKWYGIDCYDHAHYDFVLDTTHLTIPEVLETLLKFLHTYQ